MLQIIKFSADWCGPCKALAPKFEEIRQKYSENQNIVFQELDVDKHQEEATKYAIRSIPTVIVIHDGTVVDRIIGNAPEKIEKSINLNLELV